MPGSINVGILLPIPLGTIPLGVGNFFSSGGGFSLILKNTTKDKIIVEDIIVANSFFKRLKGLMFTKELSPYAGMYIYPCSSIHTFFMNYTIDVLYLDVNNKILAIDEDMKPGKVGRIVRGSVAVVELSSGKVKETKTEIGQTVQFI